MNINDKTKLIDEITRQVMEYLNQEVIVDDKVKLEKNKNVLVLGDVCHPFEDDNIFGLEDYKCDGNIKKYDTVFISSLTLWQLSDIAQCRDSCVFCCAVLKALMNDVPVFIKKEVLELLNCEKANPAINKKIQENIATILSYKVQVLNDNVKEKAKIKGTQNKSSKRVITEKEAKDLCKSSCKSRSFNKGTIITPLAKDYFAYNGVTVDFE